MSAHSSPPDTQSASPDPTSHALTTYDSDAGEWVDPEDDDDMEFELATDETEDGTEFDPDQETEDEFQDAEDGLSGVAVEEGGQTPTGEPDNQPLPQPNIQHFQSIPLGLLHLLRQRGFQLRYDEDDEFAGCGVRRRTRSKQAKANKFPPVPSEEGRRLMDDGVFGTSGCYRDTLRRKNPSLAEKLIYRETGLSKQNSVNPVRSVAQGLIPSSTADKIIHYSSRCYSGQFSDDGNFFFSCAQDFKVRMYDTSNPYDWKYYKTVTYPFGQWTITDASLSPDNRHLAYSSIRSTVCLSPTDPGNSAEPWLLDLANSGEHQGGRHGRLRGYSHFGIWSVRFSGDGRELVAGTSAPSVCVYDIETRKSIINIENRHSEDVNAVCFGDTSSPHILYSGSDDTLIKVWDRRSLGDGRAAGVFLGHTEGVTYVDSKGDGRYVLSNGKDQSMKLWDLRKMTSTETASTIDPSRYTTPGFDYRFMSYSPDQYEPHPHDSSVVTYRGHSVLKTLIRCHFSPSGSTNSRYVYSGSEDGSVYIYNIDATLAGKIDVNLGTRHSRPADPEYTNQYNLDDRRDRNSWKTCVRDASWHPNAPVIAATSWNGWGMSTGTCTTHSWNDGSEVDEGFPKMGQSVDQRLVPDKPEEEVYEIPIPELAIGRRRSTRLRSQRVPAMGVAHSEGQW